MMLKLFSKRAAVFASALLLFAFFTANHALAGSLPAQGGVELVHYPHSQKYLQGTSMPITAENARHIKIAVVKANASKNDPLKSLVGWIADMNYDSFTKTVEWFGWRSCDASLQNCSFLKPGKYKILAVGIDDNGKPVSFDLAAKALTLKKGQITLDADITSQPVATRVTGTEFSFLDVEVGDTVTFDASVMFSGIVNFTGEWQWNTDIFKEKLDGKKLVVKINKPGISTIFYRVNGKAVNGIVYSEDTRSITLRARKKGSTAIYPHISSTLKTIDIRYESAGSANNICVIIDSQKPKKQYKKPPTAASGRQVACGAPTKSTQIFSVKSYNKYWVSIVPFNNQKRAGNGVFAHEMDVPSIHSFGTQNHAPGKISDYYQISDPATYHRDMISVTQKANWKPKKNPVLTFDYKMPAEAQPSFWMYSRGGKYFYFVGAKGQAQSIYPNGMINFVKDDQWHRAEIDFGTFFKNIGQENIVIDTIVIEDFKSAQNQQKYQYSLANFPSFIKNFNLKLKQGDQPITYHTAAGSGVAGPIGQYYSVKNTLWSDRDMVHISNNAKYRPKKNPVIEFDYRIPPEAKLSLGVGTPGKSIYLFSSQATQSPRIIPVATLGLIQDNQWHRASINIYDLIGRRNVTFQEIWLEDFESPVGATYSYEIANFSSFIQNLDIRNRQGDHAVTVKSNQGTLAFSQPPTQVESQQVVSATPNVRLAAFNLRSSDEAFKVETLTLGLSGNRPGSALSVLTIKYPTDASKPTVLDGSSTVHVPVNATEVIFQGLQFAAPRDVDVRFDVYGSFNSVDGSSVKSGDSVRVSLPVISNDATRFKAVGQSSGSTVSTTGTTELFGNYAYLRKSIPTFTYNSFNQRRLTFAVDADLLKFDISANNTGDIDLYQFEFSVSPSGLDLGSTNGLTIPNGWKLYDVSNLSQPIAVSTYDAQNKRVIFRFDGLGSNAGVQSVSSGSTKTFLIRAPIFDDNNQATPALLSIKPTLDVAAGNTASAASVSAQAEDRNNFVWSDQSDPQHSVTTSDWTNGYRLSIPEFFYHFVE